MRQMPCRLSIIVRNPLYHTLVLAKSLINDPVNQRMYPQSNESSSLVPNTHNIIFPMSALHVLPPSIHHTLVCLSLSHFVNSLPVSAGKRLTAGNWDKIYQHRGAAIRELTASIGKQKTRCSNATITSVMMFLAAEVSLYPYSSLIFARGRRARD